ncbi:hypothetical protein [Longispora urticae]
MRIRVLVLAVLLAGCAGPPTPRPTPVAVAPVLGTLFYFDQAATRADRPAVLWSVRGDVPRQLLTVDRPSAAGMHAGWSLTVSPDGTRAAWVEEDRLLLADLESGTRTTVRGGVFPICSQPAWSPDSTRLLITLRQLDPATGGSTGVADKLAVLTLGDGTVVPRTFRGGCQYHWSGDGRTLARVGPELDGMSLVDLDTQLSRPVPQVQVHPPGSEPRATVHKVSDVQGVSRDAGRVAVTVDDPRAGRGDLRDLWSNAVLDTRTGGVVALPVPGRLLNAFFQPDGGMLLRIAGPAHNELVLVSATDTVLARFPERAEVRELPLLWYRPGP